MKKWLIAVVLIIISSMGVACGKDPTISYAKSQIQINFDESYIIDEDDIKINNSKKDYLVSILDTDIAELDGLTIVPKTKGNTYIRFAIEDEDVYVDIPLIVTYIIYATSAEIESNNVVININNSQETYNRITLNAGCNEQPQISYDRNIISYNYITGQITPVAVGTTNVIVLFNSCNVSFSVVVIDKVYTSAIEIEEHSIYTGESGFFEFNVFPELANTYRFYSFSEKLQVSDNGEYLACSSGEIDVYVEYYVNADTPVVKSFKVKIIDELERFDFSIKNADDTDCKYYLKEKSYKIVIPDIQNVTSEDITISNTFVLDSIEIVDNSVEVLGTFGGSGEQTITIKIVSNGKEIEKSYQYQVYQISDIEIVAKWSAYNQQPYNDGKYYIKLEETADYPSYLKFYLTINGTTISDSFEVYDITDEKTKVTSTFTPDSVGEFVFSFEFMGTTIGEIIVVVE